VANQLYWIDENLSTSNATWTIHHAAK